jgi:predicted RNA methylase
MTIDTGLNRNLIDKFYTKKNTVEYCINLIKKYIEINKNKDLIIEPSAGNGSFIPYIEKLSNNYVFYDLKPENPNIIKKNFFKLNSKSLLNKYDKIHVIGNPPFGRQSRVAIKFIKKACEFCDTLSFILPKSFKKESVKSKIPLNFHLLIQKDLPKNSFTVNGNDYDVPCVFQIWVKKPFNRKIIKNIKPIFFQFVKKNENPDISVRRIGYYAGRIDKNIINKNINTHYFIKFNNNVNSNIINELIKIKYKNNNTVGPRSISKNELIIKFNKIYKRIK